MAKRAPHSPEQEQELIEEIQAFYLDPIGFVYFNFPWGEEGPLKTKKPRTWQLDRLERMAAHLHEQVERNGGSINFDEAEVEPEMYRGSTVSGRGIGKSAEVGWLSSWFLSTRIGGSVVLTANTDPQLRSKTMPEVRKWFALGQNRHWWDPAAMSVRPTDWFRNLVQDQLRIDCSYYYLMAQLWSEENPDAFAGLHNHNGVMLIMDEASGIPQCIYDVSEGFFTEPVLDRFWLEFSNGRRLEGPFYQHHTDPVHMRDWDIVSIDSRTVEGVDKRLFERLIEKHGIDSNIVRVEVLGKFPRAEDDKAIPADLVDAAMSRDVDPTESSDIVWGVDPARFGDDDSALCKRRGNHLLERIKTWSKLNTMQLAGRIKHEWDITPFDMRPIEIMVDSIGIGAGVSDRLRELGLPAVDVNVAESPALGETYLNLRSELWFAVREWLEARNCVLPDDMELKGELIAPGYEITSSGKIKLESKEQMRKRGVKSPNRADALVLTFGGTAAVATHYGRGYRTRRSGPTKRKLKRIA